MRVAEEKVWKVVKEEEEMEGQACRAGGSRRKVVYIEKVWAEGIREVYERGRSGRVAEEMLYSSA